MSDHTGASNGELAPASFPPTEKSRDQGNFLDERFAFPLSPPQEKMWRANQAEPGNPSYNASFRWKLEGPLDTRILERAFRAIIRRHEVLRATITEIGGKPAQLISPSLSFSILVEDLRSVSASRREDEVDRLCAEEACRGFDLETGPLIRAGLLRLEDESYILMLTVHHIVFDGWSTGLIMEELREIYSAYAEGRESPLPELAIQYGDYVVWQSDWIAREEIGKQLDYWKKKLTGYRRTEVRPDFPRPSKRTTNSAIVSTMLSRELTDALKEFSNRQGGTMYATTFAVCMALLRVYTGERDISIGSPLAGRNRAELESLIGLFVNHVVFRDDMPGDPLFTEFAEHVKDTVWEAFANQDVPFERVIASVRPGVDDNTDPFFAINFICQREYARASTFVFDFAGIRMSTMPSKSQGALYELNFFMVEREAGWRLSLEYNTDLYSPATAGKMLGDFRKLLESVAANPERRLSELFGSPEPQVAQDLHIADPVTPSSSKFGNAETSESYALSASLAQKRFWWLESIAPGNTGFHMPAAVRLVGALSQSTLLKSFQALVDRHEILRTTFDEIHGELVQIIAASRKVSLPFSNLESVQPADRPMKLEEMLREEAQRSFDLKQGPLMRAHLYKLAAEEHVLLITTHHILADGWSQNILQRELWTFYEALGKNQAPELTPLAIQYADFAHWQKDWLASEEARGHMDFWTSRLTGRLPVLDFPTDRPPRNQPPSEGAIETRLLPEDLVREAKKLGQSQDTTLFTLMLACFGALLFRYAGQDDVLIGSPVANRRGETEPLIGPFAGPVCLRLDLSGNPTLKELMRRVREVTLDALSHTDLPFEALLERLDTRSSHGRSPLFQFYFFYQKAFLQPRELEGLTVTPLPNMGLGIPFEIQFGLVERNEGVRAQLEYNRDLFDVATIVEILGFYETVLKALVANPDMHLSDLPVPVRATRTKQGDREPSKRSIILPRNSRETRLAEIWMEVLGLHEIGIEEDFFELGGHSLLVIKAVSRIRDTFEVDLPLRTFFAHPTIAGLAQTIIGRKAFEPAIERIPVRPPSSSCPLSFAQERLWYLDQLVPESPVYNVVDVIRWSGAFSLPALKKSLQELSARHESFRTCFSRNNGQPVQIILPSVELPLEEIDLSSFPEEQRQREWSEIIRRDGRKPFNLAQAPLLRLTVAKLSDREHLLLLTIHHIIADEWSLQVLRSELHQLYHAFARNRPSPLPALSIQYADFACWQRNALRQNLLDTQIAYWKTDLDGAPTRLDLPTDKPRPAVQTFRGATEAFSLPKALTEPLKALSRQQGATLFMALAAAFMTLLHRYTGQDDILLATPISGRTRRETEGLIGFFLNTVILRGEFSASQDFVSLLRQVKERALGAYAHQDLPFERVVAEIAPGRDLSHSPLVQVMFVLHSANDDLPETKLKLSEPLETGTSKFDLTLSISETPDGLSGLIEYSTDLFEPGTLQRMAGHYQTLLEAIARDPAKQIATLPLLTEAEQRQMAEWSNSKTEYWKKDLCLHQLVEEQVQRAPEQVAVVFEKRQLMYRELDERANQLAHYLRKLGAGPNVLIGVCMERSIEMVVALLGILKSGAAYLPLDPAYPQERLAFMIADAKPLVVLTQESLKKRLSERSARIVYVDSDAGSISREAKNRPENKVRPDDLAYVIYTSGSTGKPKGVLVTHYNVVRLFQSTADWFKFDQHDVWTMFHSYAFDFSVWELWGGLVHGGRVVVVPYLVSRSPGEFYQLLQKEHVTVLNQTPSSFRQLIAAEEKQGKRKLSLRLVIFGGEALEMPSLKPWFERHGDRMPQLVNMYGITETTVHVTYRPLTAEDVRGGSVIGRPIPDLSIHLLDRNKQIVPIGVAGEVCVGGAGVAKGYLNRDELTAEKFVSDIFNSQSGERLYRSGDQARYLANGDIEYLGRIDDQIKIRGFRVELGEIESAISEYPGIRQTVVVAREDTPGDKRLVAYFVHEENGHFHWPELRDSVRKKLPEYMLPSAFVSLKEMPLSSNGKIDRKSLPNPSNEAEPVPSESRSPSTKTEKELVAIWEEVLRIKNVGVTSNFFDLGGHSLNAVRLLSCIESAFGKELPLASLLEAQTIEQQARLIDGTLSQKHLISKRPRTSDGGAAISLFYLGGDPTFRPLSQELDALHGFHSLGMQASLVQDMVEPYSLERIAKHFVSAVRERQPEGPYILGGWCSHGLLALEVAQQLRAQGQEIALLILLEVLQPVKMKEYPAWKWHITAMQLKLHLLKFEYAYLRQVKGAQAFSYLKERFSRKMSEIKHFLMGPLRFSKNGKNHSVSINPLDILYSAASNYRPKPYPGPAVLFRCEDHTFGFAQDPRLGWGDTLGPDLEICTTPGNHYTFYLEPNVNILAREMNARMRKAEERLNHGRKREAVKSDVRATTDSASNAARTDAAVPGESPDLAIREGKVVS